MFYTSRKRQAILSAGFKLFAELGYDAITVADIARRAGVTLATFYKYFPNKKRLAREIYRDVRIELEASLEHLAPSGISPQEQLKHLVARMFHFAEQDSEALNFLETNDHRSYLDSSERYAPAPRPIINFMNELRQQGAIKDIPSTFLAMMVWGAFVQWYRVARSGQEPILKQADPFATCIWDALRKVGGNR